MEWNEFTAKVLSYDEGTVGLLFGVAIEAVTPYFAFIDRCESPIERQMGIAMLIVFERLLKERKVEIEPQAMIECGERQFRVDILVSVATINDKRFRVAVECDGHEFHERTKEQAAQDKERDRLLLLEGVHVLHFTGSEIYRDPGRCAEQVMETLIALLTVLL